MSIAKFRKKPVEITAVRWTGDNEAVVQSLTGRENFTRLDPEDTADDPDMTAQVFDRLHSTWVGVYTGQWIIKGVKGEFYPCAADVFEETYEPVSADVEAAS